MLTPADLTTALDNPWAVILTALFVGVLGAWLIDTIATAIWLRWGPEEPVERIEDDGDEWLSADAARRLMEGGRL